MLKAPAVQVQQREFSYTAADFQAIAKRLYDLSGIRLNPSKDSMVYSRLVRRIRTLRLAGVADYLRYLAVHPEEEQNFINALTTNLTSFFREAHHFEVLSQYLRRHPACKTIWCAASSTGEEPYSIAMTVAEHFGSFQVPVTIIASDIDSQVLATAARGVYPQERVENLSQEKLKNFFHRGVASHAGQVRVVPELAAMVKFMRINLLDEKWPLPDSIDLIFCRNVMIYFDKGTQLQILERMVKRLPEDGLYIAGHSENFSHANHLVKPNGKTTYKPVKHRS
jgi:chemotaxis protein methyltransferase CheR